MRIQCNKFDTKPASCRFYAFPEGKDRAKVHVDGPVDFARVAADLSTKSGENVTADQCRAAYEAA